MTTESWWGLVIMVWVLSALPMIAPLDERFNIPIRTGWCAGLIALLLAYAADWHPIVAIAVAASLVGAAGLYVILRR